MACSRVTAGLRGAMLTLWIAAPLLADEPRAALRGPATAQVGETVLLSVAGTVSDEEPILKLAEGPPGVVVDVSPLYTRDGKLAYGLVAVPSPGEYWFAILARGTPSGAAKPIEDFALWRVRAGEATPIPGPVPPGPTPTPGPVLVGRAYLSYVLPDFPTPVQAALRVDPGLRSDLVALDAGWRTYLRSEDDLDRLRLRPVIDRAMAGGATLPLTVIQDATGHVVSLLGESSARGIVDHVKKLRGL